MTIDAVVGDLQPRIAQPQPDRKLVEARLLSFFAARQAKAVDVPGAIGIAAEVELQAARMQVHHVARRQQPATRIELEFGLGNLQRRAAVVRTDGDTAYDEQRP